VVGSTVTLYAQDVLAWPRWIDDAQIDAETCYTHLRVSMESGLADSSRNGFSERTIEATTG
jgi:hypothetical protein